MILRRIKLKNIKAYYGEQTLELQAPAADRRIHLLGAPNGTGKTTLFESIHASLFASQTDPILRANYLSRGAAGRGANEMEVEVEFEHEAQSYVLNRRWVPKPGRSEESADSVTLYSLLQNMDTGDSSRDDDEIADFVDSLIPRDIGHFFLFDGEQIQAYTDAAAKSVKDALERLLGLHHYIQLLEDLGKVESDLRREQRSHDVGEELNRKLEALEVGEARLRTIDRQRQEVRRAAAESKRELTALQREEDRFASVFDQQLQAKRRELIASRGTLEVDISNQENELKQLISNELVVSWFWPQISQAASMLAGSKGALPATVDDLAEFLLEHRDRIVPAINNGDRGEVCTAILAAIGVSPDTALYSEMGDGIEELAVLIEKARDKLWSTSARLDSLKAELDRVIHELDVLPSAESLDTDVQELHRRMAEVRTLQTRHEATLAELGKEETRLRQQADDLNKDVTRLSGQKSVFRLLTAQLEVGRRLQDALRNFVSDYRRTRIDELEDIMNQKFRELTNIPELLERVEIDRDNFEINIRLRSSTDLAALEQSAGQKEVLAFALIASVVELSNKQLPAIIDTPLARLDAAHRDNILTRFFPYVGPQVIILATDTEVGREERLKLSRYLASEHHLHRDSDSGRTTIKEGYLVE